VRRWFRRGGGSEEEMVQKRRRLKWRVKLENFKDK